MNKTTKLIQISNLFYSLILSLLHSMLQLVNIDICTTVSSISLANYLTYIYVYNVMSLYIGRSRVFNTIFSVLKIEINSLLLTECILFFYWNKPNLNLNTWRQDQDFANLKVLQGAALRYLESPRILFHCQCSLYMKF